MGSSGGGLTGSSYAVDSNAGNSWSDARLQMWKHKITLGPFWANELVGMLWNQMTVGRLATFSCKVVAVSCLKLIVALKELQVCSSWQLEPCPSSQKSIKRPES